MKLLFLVATLLIFSCNGDEVISQVSEIETREVAGNFRTVWEILWGQDDYIWLTERGGKISRLNPETGETTLLLTIPDVFENGERGLMGMALHPDFTNNPFVYVAYNYGSTNENTRIRIARYTYSEDKLTSPMTLLEEIKGWWNHNGARIVIDNNLKLWFTIGDAAHSDLAQNLDNLNGKLCRMNLDGSVPEDNPFAGSRIWSFGHRNQQGLVIVNGKIYTSEHGTNIDDEINMIEKGRNYGWPQVEGYCDKPAEIDFCEQNNVAEPILTLNPEATLAIAGIDYYNNDLIPQWKNSLIITSLKAARIVVAKLSESGNEVISTEEYFTNQFGRLRDVCVAPDGRVFFATSNQDGRGTSQFVNVLDKIIEIKPKFTGVNQKKTELKIFPNPSNDKFTITLPENYNQFARFSIVNSIGEIVKDFTIENSNEIIWDGTDNFGKDLSSGIYRVIFFGGSALTNLPVILQR